MEQTELEREVSRLKECLRGVEFNRDEWKAEALRLRGARALLYRCRVCGGKREIQIGRTTPATPLCAEGHGVMDLVGRPPRFLFHRSHPGGRRPHQCRPGRRTAFAAACEN